MSHTSQVILGIMLLAVGIWLLAGARHERAELTARVRLRLGSLICGCALVVFALVRLTS